MLNRSSGTEQRNGRGQRRKQRLGRSRNRGNRRKPASTDPLKEVRRAEESVCSSSPAAGAHLEIWLQRREKRNIKVNKALAVRRASDEATDENRRSLNKSRIKRRLDDGRRRGMGGVGGGALVRRWPFLEV